MSSSLYVRLAPYTKASIERLGATHGALRHVDGNNIVGDFVECGVWAGGHIILSRMVSPSRLNWLYDTFEGMTEPTHRDTKRSGVPAIPRYRAKKQHGDKWDAVSLEQVKHNLTAEGVYDEDKLKFVVGDVCQTLDQPENLPDRIAVLRLDTDWYESTKKELEVLYPRLVSGGVLIVDDYNHWMGCREAVRDYLGKRTSLLTPIDYCSVMMVKP